MENTTSSPSIDDPRHHHSSYFAGGREEVSEVLLQPVEGSGPIPESLYGVVYIATQCGSVNSGGLPYLKTLKGRPNPEFGSPNLTGDGMVFRFDLNNPGSIKLSSRIVREATFYADEATSIHSPGREKYPGFAFKNMGISRGSLTLGTRNLANTALIPVRFPQDTGISLLATYDTGRPIKIDPASLKPISPIGWNTEWTTALPPFLRFPFPLIETTAHPTFDPGTQELFTVNFTKSPKNEFSRRYLYQLLQTRKGHLKDVLRNIAQEHLDGKSTPEEAVNRIEKEIVQDLDEKKPWWRRVLDWLWKYSLGLFKQWIKEETSTIDQLFLFRFTGEGPMKKWRVVDEQGNNLVITQCMHQTGLSRNYIVLMDCSFKFAFDLLISNPFPDEPIIDEFLRKLSARTMMPTTRTWLVPRAALREDSDTVAAIPTSEDLPFECVHFSANYDDTGDQVTIYTAHNSAACLAEWIRPYDKPFFSNQAPYTEDLIGGYAVGEMAVGAIGKFTIDGKTGRLADSKIIREKGNLPPLEQLSGEEPLTGIGSNTWGVGLYTYRDMISPTQPIDRIRQLYFVNFGINPAFLTEFIFNLYRDYPNRDMPLEELLEYAKRGIPESLLSIDAETMEIKSSFEFTFSEYPQSIQFLPCRERNENRPAEEDGYLLVTVKAITGKDSEGRDYYQSQLWLFEAWEALSKGPVCRLAAPNFNFCASLHSTWLEEKAPVSSSYQIDVRKDYDPLIQHAVLFWKRPEIEHFFEEYIYPHFE